MQSSGSIYIIGGKTVKKSASTLLSEGSFWSIIENSNKGKSLKIELEKLTEDEIIGYKYWWVY
jgi:hypothetical protein